MVLAVLYSPDGMVSLVSVGPGAIDLVDFLQAPKAKFFLVSIISDSMVFAGSYWPQMHGFRRFPWAP